MDRTRLSEFESDVVEGELHLLFLQSSPFQKYLIGAMERWVRHSTCRKPEPRPRLRSRPRWESKTDIAHYTYDIVLEDWTLGPKVNGTR